MRRHAITHSVGNTSNSLVNTSQNSTTSSCSSADSNVELTSNSVKLNSATVFNSLVSSKKNSDGEESRSSCSEMDHQDEDETDFVMVKDDVLLDVVN